MTSPIYCNLIDKCVDQIIAKVGNDIVLGIPLGIGKPNPLVNALYRRAKANPENTLKIVTALSLGRPKATHELEKRLMGPIVERVFGNYPDLDYVVDLRDGRLPSNVEVSEFFMKTGEYLNNRPAQQHYIYSNYSHAARDVLLQGVNVLAQAVASREVDGKLSLSLSCNPDVTLDLIALTRTNNAKVLLVAMVNNELPFMPNDAEVKPDMFDFVITDPAGTHDLFAPPSPTVSLHDYAIGLHCASLVRDGGTLQIGIGSLGDAVAQALILRDRQSERFSRIVHDLSAGKPHGLADFGKMDRGLYGSTEMFCNGLLQLITAGIIRREVFPDAGLQRLLNEEKIEARVTPRMLAVLLEEGLVRTPLGKADVAFLKYHGIFRAEVKWRDGDLVVGEARLSAALDDPKAFAAIVETCLGDHLAGGVILHGGFFVGPRAFYQGLREMAPELLAKINMCRIGYVTELYGQDEIARLQRKDARFINTTMMVTLLGAAISDSLESGNLVSGVGGQYNFVAMAHALPGARSILNLRATRMSEGRLVSNIIWNYGHTTIPRHLRDIVITEYGIADLRGQSDSTVIKRMLAIADSRFQEELLETAKANGKISRSYAIPHAYRQNLPEVLKARLKPWYDLGLLPELPFGTDLTDEELTIARALRRMKATKGHPLEMVKMLLSGLARKDEGLERYLARMGFEGAAGLKTRLLRALFLGSLDIPLATPQKGGEKDAAASPILPPLPR